LAPILRFAAATLSLLLRSTHTGIEHIHQYGLKNEFEDSLKEI
jgi:hypothetical protein